MKSLYESLHVPDPRATEVAPSALDEALNLTGKEFCTAVLESIEFRRYIADGIRSQIIPSAILTRIMDHGWGKPPDRVELTGKDGEPVKTVTRIVRVIIDPATDSANEHTDAVVH